MSSIFLATLASLCSPAAAIMVCLLSTLELCLANELSGDTTWAKHIIHEGFEANTAVAADFTSDGLPDVIGHSGGRARLFVAPDWREVIIDHAPHGRAIHSEVMDVDGDGDPDYIAAQSMPSLIFWLERPTDPLRNHWKYHLIDDAVNGVHGLIVGDVDGDGSPELLANSNRPTGPLANSIVLLQRLPSASPIWDRKIIAAGNAPGLSHYLSLGDVNGDGLSDVVAAAKGGDNASPGSGDWFAWWESPAENRKGWHKHVIARNQYGATNIHLADVNNDGWGDFIATRGHGHGVVWFEAPNWTPHDIHPTIHRPHSLAVADVDNDGDIDAVTCANGNKQVVWFENNGSGHFRTHVVGRNQAAYDVRLVDIDTDGDVDILIAGHTSNNVVWYENRLRSDSAEISRRLSRM